MNFWQKIQKPIIALAPMANVTDAAFRRIIAKYSKYGGKDFVAGLAASGGPDVFWTEFTSVEGLLSRGREKLLIDFWYSESERPIVAQIFGGKPEQFFEVGKLCKELGFDGVDINMGCPDKGVEKSGGGAALIKNPKLAQEIIKATMEGGSSASRRMPVSVKTRIGYNKDEIDTWIAAVLAAKPAALTVHLRTRKEMSFVPARWDKMSRIKVIRDTCSPDTLLLGNGDVMTVADARAKAKQYGVDGVMIGRGIFGNPWLFAEKLPSVEERLRVCLEHTKLFEELFGVPATSENLKSKISNLKLRRKPFDIMKKHYKAYINGFDGAKELRVKLMEAKDVDEVEKILKAF